MGQLLFLRDFAISQSRGRDGNQGHLDPQWYFEGAYFNSGSGGGWHWEVDVERSYPHAVPIHVSHFGVGDNGSSYGQTQEQRDLKVHIRRFIERNCQGVCIYTIKDMHYEYAYEIEEKYRHLYHYNQYRIVKVHHGYAMFNFEYAEDAVAFKLRFNETSELNDRHPIFVVDEESIELAKTVPPHRAHKEHW